MPETIVAVGIDDPTAQLLTTNGYSVDTSHSAFNSVYDRMTVAPPTALILGSQSNLGADFVGQLRASHIDTPAIWISSGPRNKAWSHGCAQFLDSGGDDVIVGPANPAEVAHSVKRICRRSFLEPDYIERFEIKGARLEVNLTKQRVLVNEKKFTATGTEMVILFILASIHGVVSRTTFVKEVRDWHQFREECIDVLVCRLRKQLGDAACLLATHRGLGYELVGRVH